MALLDERLLLWHSHIIFGSRCGVSCDTVKTPSLPHSLAVCVSLSLHSLFLPVLPACSSLEFLSTLQGFGNDKIIPGHKTNNPPAQTLERLPFGIERLPFNSLAGWLFLVRMPLGDLGKGLKSHWAYMWVMRFQRGNEKRADLITQVHAGPMLDSHLCSTKELQTRSCSGSPSSSRLVISWYNPPS